MRNRGKSTSAMISSSATDVMMTVRISDPTSPSRVSLVSDDTSSRCVRPMRRDTAMPSSDASVITPRPPIWMATRMTTRPQADQYSPVGTTTRPVTVLAEAAVNSASTNGARCPVAVAHGADRPSVTSAMTSPNTPSASRAGDCRAERSTYSRARHATPGPPRAITPPATGPALAGRGNSGMPRACGSTRQARERRSPVGSTAAASGATVSA